MSRVIASRFLQWRQRFIPILLPCLFALMIYDAARLGADRHEYLSWARVALSGDIFALQGNVLSPMGVPVSQWAHGVGFTYAVGQLFFGEGHRLEASAIGVSWLMAVIMWASIFSLLSFAGSRKKVLICFGAGIAFLGTHLGYFSHVYASENLSAAFLAVLAFWCIKPGLLRGRDGLVAGVVSGLLLLVRLQLAPYVGLALVVVLVRVWRESHGDRTRRLSIAGIAFLIPVALSSVQILAVNRWMTGSFLRSAYQFGSGGFRSLDMLHPEFGAVLFHSWHGLVMYHPLYLLCFISLVWLMVSNQTVSLERWLYGGLIIAFYIHLHVQAAWYCWWLGKDAFGMRGMGATAVLFVPVFVRTLSLMGSKSCYARWLAIMAILATVWSSLLLWQQESNFVTYAGLSKAQGDWLSNPFFLLPLLAIVGVAAGMWWLRWRQWEGGGGMASTASGLLAFSAYYFVRKVPQRACTTWGTGAGYLVAVGLAFIMAVGTFFLLARLPKYIPVAHRVVVVTTASFLVVLFCLSGLLFAQVAIHVEQLFVNGIAPPRSFRYVGSACYDEIKATYDEYLRVPGFEAKKRALRGYLRDAGVLEEL